MANAQLITVLALAHSFFQDSRVPRERGGPIQFLEELVPHPERAEREKGAKVFLGVASVSPELYEEFYENHRGYLGFEGSVRDDATAAMDAYDDERGVKASPVSEATIPISKGKKKGKKGKGNKKSTKVVDDGDPSNDNPLKGLDFASPNSGELARSIDGLCLEHFEGISPSGKNGFTTVDVRKAAKALRETN